MGYGWAMAMGMDMIMANGGTERGLDLMVLLWRAVGSLALF